jgi:acetyltransferase-like isoleucine patch superfamily enzyme
MVRASLNAYYWTKSTFWVTPLFKGLCSTVGKNFKAGTFVPFVVGTGAIHVGDHVKFYGKQTFLFAAIKDALPEIRVGDNTGFGHNTVFDIAGKLTIGRHCMIASNVMFQDCSGHSIVADIRAADTPPTEKDVKEISVGDNVWIGTGAYILPGAVIGDNCVIAANTAVSRKIPNNSLVYAPSPKIVEIRDISKVV